MREKKERAPHRKGPSRTRLAELDGAPVAYIELNAGHEAIVDAEDLDRVMRIAGHRCWQLMSNSEKRKYAVVRQRRENGGYYCLDLGKVIARPGRREAVVFDNDNRLDCRKANMALMHQTDELRRRRGFLPRRPVRRLAMTSIEVTSFTGKDHEAVSEDIRLMLKALGTASQIAAEPRWGPHRRRHNKYYLDHFHTEVLLAGYETKRRAELVRFWLDAEPPSGAR